MRSVTSSTTCLSFKHSAKTGSFKRRGRARWAKNESPLCVEVKIRMDPIYRTHLIPGIYHPKKSWALSGRLNSSPLTKSWRKQGKRINPIFSIPTSGPGKWTKWGFSGCPRILLVKMERTNSWRIRQVLIITCKQMSHGSLTRPGWRTQTMMFVLLCSFRMRHNCNVFTMIRKMPPNFKHLRSQEESKTTS